MPPPERSGGVSGAAGKAYRVWLKGKKDVGGTLQEKALARSKVCLRKITGLTLVSIPIAGAGKGEAVCYASPPGREDDTAKGSIYGEYPKSRGSRLQVLGWDPKEKP